MQKFIFLCKEIGRGKSVTRAFYNYRLKHEMLVGAVIDVGGGRSADYLSFMPRSEDVEIRTFDVKAGANIDFEVDQLPASDGSFDTVLFLNVMEHIYNYKNIISEVHRITKPGGRVIGVVPFLMWYHSDPKDYFRYTHEALEKIFTECNIATCKIEVLARGPFTAAAQMVMQSLPRLVRIPVFALHYFLDAVFLWLRPGHGERYTLGYYFELYSESSDIG
jgi:SAM-dependent methyltransferase